MRFVSDHPQIIEECVGAFEAVRYRRANVDLASFLPPRNHPQYAEVAVELIRVDLEHSWRQGARKCLADYQQQFSEVLADKTNLEQVAFEEYRLRRIAGEYVTREHYGELYHFVTEDWPELPLGDDADSAAARLPHVDAGAIVAAGSSDSQQRLPEVGDRFLDFELVSELGRGALGRVYLARQGDLARRFVALKITARGCEEAQRLARLQHTNIVPIYSFHTYQSLQAVCMPFLGRRTLAEVVQAYRAGQPFPASGQALVGTWNVHFASTLTTEQTPEEQAAAIASQTELHARPEVVRRMEHMTFIEAAAWMMSRIADGLAHAHEHGIVHRDLKPANILLSDDGEPLILDFHLSAHRPAEAVMGGTLPYMSPEQLRALLQGGEVGPQSDVYSLGVIFFELLTGTTPYPIRTGVLPTVIDQMLADRRQPIPSVRRLNKRVSPDIESIVHHCLANSGQRYESARQLHEDLLRHLEHRPLRHAANPSFVERGRKWMRRHPQLFSTTSLVALATAALLTALGSFGLYSERLARSAAGEDWRDLQGVLASARTALNTRFIDQPALEQSVQETKRALDEFDLLHTQDVDETDLFANIADEDRPQLRQDVFEALYLLASGTGQLAQRGDFADREKLLQEALRYNELCQNVLQGRSPPRALLRQKQRLLLNAGDADAALEIKLPVPSSTDPRDQRLLAHEAAQRQDYAEAARLLREVRRAYPQDPTVWFSLGSCYLGLQQYEEALHSFDTALALRNDLLLARELRGFALLQLERYREALSEFDAVLAKRPNAIAALMNRSLALEKLGDTEGAIAALSAALKQDGCPTRAYFRRAELRARVGDERGADEDRQQGFSLTPNDEPSWIARGVARMPQDSEAALADFHMAIKLNPKSLQARQNMAHVYAERLDRTAEAIDVLGEMLDIDPEDAATRVTRGVLYARLGKREEAIADADAALKLADKPLLYYQCACIYALTSRQHPEDANQALELFGRALKKDWQLFRFAASDHDLDAIRTRSQFQNLVTAARTLQQLP